MIILQVAELVSCVNSKECNLYGFSADRKTGHMHTLDSLMLTLLPSAGSVYKPQQQDGYAQLSQIQAAEEDIQVVLLRSLLSALVTNAGFRLPKVSSGYTE